MPPLCTVEAHGNAIESGPGRARASSRSGRATMRRSRDRGSTGDIHPWALALLVTR